VVAEPQMKNELRIERRNLRTHGSTRRFLVFKPACFLVLIFALWLLPSSPREIGRTAAISLGKPVCEASVQSLFDSQSGQRGRPAAVYFSDGKVLTGNISLTPGRSFKLNIPKAGKLKTTDMITGEDVQYGKVRQFTFRPVREIRFYPEREEMRRKWRFTEKTKYNEETAEADYSPAAKEYSGDPYPLRYLAATVIFNSGESLEGHLYTATVYLESGEKTHRMVLGSKQRGAEGTTLDDLVYVSRIKLLDEGESIAAKVTVKFTDMRLGPEDAVQAVTEESLTPIPTKLSSAGSTCIVESAFGEQFYLAARIDGAYIVGWPKERDEELFALAEDHLARHRDFYNSKQLLGVLASEDTGSLREIGRTAAISRGEVLTLVSLRRKVAPTHFGKIGGEWDRQRQALVEPWRLSIWRWKRVPQTRENAFGGPKHDKANRELILTSRGTFFRRILLPEEQTPQAILSEKLWRLRYEGDTVTVGVGTPPGGDPVLTEKDLQGTRP
jgi:hypothetical protein